MSKVLEVYRILKDKLGEEEARVVAEAFEELGGARENLATKDDIESLNQKIENLRAEVKQDIENLRAEIKQDVDNLRAEVKQDIKALDQKIVNFRTEVKQDIENLRAEVKYDIKNLRTELKQDTENLRQEFKGEIGKLDVRLTRLESRLWWIVGIILVQWLSLMIATIFK